MAETIRRSFSMQLLLLFKNIYDTDTKMNFLLVLVSCSWLSERTGHNFFLWIINVMVRLASYAEGFWLKTKTLNHFVVLAHLT